MRVSVGDHAPRSTDPNMIVDVVRSPTECAASMTDSHSAVRSLSGQRMSLTSSSNT